MKIGIIQGRLSEPLNGFQECPENWKREFEILPDIGLSHIEWIVTSNSYKNNPIFSEDVSSYNISSICADNLVTTDITNWRFLRENLDPICKSAIANKIPCVTIPLLEYSNMNDTYPRSQFIDCILQYADNYPTLIFSFEIESHEGIIDSIIYLRDNFRLTYDTGNMTSLGINHEYYITKYFDKINNVHLKDRTFEGETVQPGTGKTNFKQVFNILSDLGYDKNYTIQTARGKDGDEIKTIVEHKNILEGIYNG